MNIWMVRAGEQSRLIEEFKKGYIAVGWIELGDMTEYPEKEQIRKRHREVYPNAKKGAVPMSISMFHKFRSILSIGDKMVTYDRFEREYLVGEIIGDYEYKPDVVGDYPHIRKVDWQGKVSRDDLSTASKNTLGSTLTLFSVPVDVWEDLKDALAGEKPSLQEEDLETEGSTLEDIKNDAVEKAHEFIKDKILTFSPEDMEELVAAVLRAMGYRARVSPKGADRGMDVFASPDGLGLEEPRIKAEVKHRRGTAMGSQEIRSFLGGLRVGDRGVYVSTGGFTKDAKYEAERSNIPLTLVNLDDLARLVVDFYEEFDLDGRALIPLVRVYMPVE